MECVILAGGKGTRLAPYTNDIPKPLVKVGGKTLLDHLITTLEGLFDKIIIVVDHYSEKIQQHLNASIYSTPIVFVNQSKDLKGTYGAVFSAKDLITETFLVICSDNIYSHSDIIKLQKAVNSMLVKQVHTQEKQLSYQTSKRSLIKFHDVVTLEAGAWHLDKSFFNLLPSKVENTEEYGIPHTIYSDYKTHTDKYHIVNADFWFPVGTVWELEHINYLLGTGGINLSKTR